MMTPLELRQYEFKSAGRNAYKADDVDAFFGGVIVDYEKMYRENAELVKRMSLLADRLERFKQDENEIKQAVLSAQKAADIIVREAQNSVEDTKLEAEAILAAAKGEADIIKSDAEKQAIADSELLLSIARDKAESIIDKAKEEAHGILIEANDSASDTVGAATRTITSESIHYEMLKKEVSDFRASILAQYKAHIEMISKLPELADEEAERVLSASENETDSPVAENVTENEESENSQGVAENNIELDEDVKAFDSSDAVAEIYFDDTASETDVDTVSFVEPEPITEQEDEVSEAEPVTEETDFIKIDVDTPDEEDFSDEADTSADVHETDIPISKGFSFDSSAVEADDLRVFFDDDESSGNASIFDSISKVDTDVVSASDEEEDDDEEDDEKPKSGFRFFRKKK